MPTSCIDVCHGRIAACQTRRRTTEAVGGWITTPSGSPFLYFAEDSVLYITSVLSDRMESSLASALAQEPENRHASA
jgi:hypothetical protein